MPNLFMIHLGTIYPDFIRETTAHELGHYYWSLYVLAAGEERLDWLMLANGIWADHLYMAEVSGKTIEAEWRERDLFNWFELYAAGLCLINVFLGSFLGQMRFLPQKSFLILLIFQRSASIIDSFLVEEGAI